VIRRDAQRRAHRRDASGIANELPVVNGIQHGGDARRIGPVSDQLASDVARDRDQSRETGEHALVGRVVEVPLSGGVAGPSVDSGDGARAGGFGQQQRKQIGLVVVSVKQIDLPLRDQLLQLSPDVRIERVPFLHFHVVDRRSRRSLMDLEHFVALIPQVAHRNLRVLGVRHGGAEQDGLLRPAAGAAHAAQFENANRT
jgi:hypothetical protein